MMTRLPQRVHMLRVLLPVAAFVAVLVHQVFEHTVLRSLPWGWHFASQLVFYGLAGPLIVWAMLTWIAQSVDAQDRVTRQLSTLYTFSRRLATTPDEHLLATIVAFPAQLLDGVVGCTLTLFNDRTGTASVEATWGLSPPAAETIRHHVSEEARYHLCTACQALRATVSRPSRCPALPESLVKAAGVRTVICLPIGRGEKRIGHLNVYLNTDSPLPADLLQLLNAVAAEAAPAIEAARLRARELAALYHLDRTIRHRLDLEGMLQQIVQEAVEACEAEEGAILLRDEPGGPFRVRVTVPANFALEAASAVGELVAERQAPVYIGEPEGRGASAVAVPMTVGDEVFGVLYLAHTSLQTLGERQVRLLSAIASQAALLVQNARFYERLEGYAILEERARLAREIHDGLAQGLGYLHLKAQQALRRLHQNRAEDAAAELASMRTVIQELYAEARAAIDGLRAPFDPHRSFAANLRAYVDRLSDRHRLPVRLELPAPDFDLPPTTAAHVFRIVQEGLNNIVKHAHAEQAVVRVQEDDDGLHITIEDDGCGFDMSRLDDRAHFGLRIMQERAEVLGGTLEVRSHIGQGTVVSLHLPREELMPFSLHP